MDRPKRKVWDIGGAIAAATLAAACCVLPLVLVSLGVGGAWIGNLTGLLPYRPFFILLAVSALIYAFYREYKTSTGVDCDCEAEISDPVRRSLLVVATLVTLGLVGSPYLMPRAATTMVVEEIDGSQQATLVIEGMTCASCTPTAKRAITNLKGVHGAQVSYEPPEALVYYDPDIISAQELADAVTQIGYPTHVVLSSLND